jgi:hypothetical protein
MDANRGSPWPAIYRWVGIIGYALMAVYVLLQTKPPFYDEVYHLEQVRAFRSSSSFYLWLVNNDSSATGPVYALLHRALALGGNSLPPPWLRLPNLVLLGIVLVTMAHALRHFRHPQPGAAVMAVLAVPMIWVISGMALTEIPAMTGIAAAYYAAAVLGSDGPVGTGRKWLLMGLLAGGVAIGVCGRQTYLVAVPALILLGAETKKPMFRVAAAAAVGLIPAGLLFLVWRGLVPPRMAYIGGGLRMAHAAYAICYVGVTSLLIAPRFLCENWRWILPAGVISVLANLVAGALQFTPLASAQRWLGSPGLAAVLEGIASQAFVVAGVALVVAVALNLWKSPDRRFAANASGVILLCGVCACVTAQFSSRYVCMTVPFLIPMLAPWMEFSPWAVGRLVLGMGLGAAALHSYFFFA